MPLKMQCEIKNTSVKNISLFAFSREKYFQANILMFCLVHLSFVFLERMKIENVETFFQIDLYIFKSSTADWKWSQIRKEQKEIEKFHDKLLGKVVDGSIINFKDDENEWTACNRAKLEFSFEINLFILSKRAVYASLCHF